MTYPHSQGLLDTQEAETQSLPMKLFVVVMATRRQVGSTVGQHSEMWKLEGVMTKDCHHVFHCGCLKH